MKNVLVTGCAGFLGYNLCKRFLENGDFVCGIDNFVTGINDNILKLQEYNNFLFYENRRDELFENLSYDIKQDFDQVYHAASPASPPVYNKLPFQTIKVNTEGTYNLAIFAYLKKAKFMFFSTSEIYGQPLVVPQSEKYTGNVNTIGPRSIYDESKRLGETITYEFFRRHKLDVKIPRIHNTYGPGMSLNDGRVVTNFIKQSFDGEPLTIYGDGSNFRCFCYVDDMIDGLIALMNSDCHSPVNLGSDKKYTVKELADIVNSLFLKSVDNFVSKELPIDDPKHRQPDLTKAKKILNWSPKISLAEGIQKTIDSYVVRL